MSKLILQTKRLLLREFDAVDASPFYEMNKVEEVIQYTGDVPFTSVEAALQFIQNYDVYQRIGLGRWTIVERKTGEYLGFCGLKYHSQDKKVDLGYRIPLKYWGKGYATEAAAACLNYGFTVLKLKRIIGQVDKRNLASIRVLQKIGMKFYQDADFDGVPGMVFQAISSDHKNVRSDFSQNNII